MVDKEMTTFKYGIIDAIEEQSIPPGSLSEGSDFITKGDKQELAGGNLNLGATEITQDPSLGIHVGFKRNGDEILFRKRGRKLEVYDLANDIWNESGTDLFPAEAVDDEISFVNYDSIAGSQVFISSENSSIYKIMLANPLTPVDMLQTDYRGHIFGSQNRLFLVGRKGTNRAIDDTGVYVSFIDSLDYTAVTAESVGTGDGSTTTFPTVPGTPLVFKAGGSKRTCFDIVLTDGVETFVDDKNGNLVGSLGGTGTINYANGVYSVTFATAPLLAAGITVNYQWEDSTNGGIADFSFTSPTRLAGEGDVFRQDAGGGKALSVRTFQDHEFCFHERKTWDLVLSSDDTGATNDQYRDKVGIPNWRASASDGEGVYYIDDTDKNKPLLRQLKFNSTSTEILPSPLSLRKSLKGYLFDKCWMIVNDNFVIWGCRRESSITNDTIFIYDKQYKSIDQFARFSSCGALYQGSLVVGDSLSPNVYACFSGFDDNGAQQGGFMVTNLWDLTFADFLKKSKEVWIEGEIQRNQIIAVSVAVDHGSYVPVGIIRGDGSYVDSQAVTIGSNKIGRLVIGGRPSGAVTAFHYNRPLKLRLDKFGEIKLKLEVTSDSDGQEGIGYFSVTKIRYHDIRLKQKKLPNKYRVLQ